jgi:nucleotide-binding universal stress UspA family protein
MFKHILIPTDGSELATAAVDRGLELASALGARVTFLTVIEPFHLLSYHPAQLQETHDTYLAESMKHATGITEACEAKAKAKGVEARSLVRRSDHPFVEIGAAADGEGVDLIAIASHGRRGITAMVLGSQTAKVLAQSKIPVLVYR